MQGIGEALIKRAMEFAKDDKATSIELSTVVDNYTAQKLYEKIGFVQQKPTSDFLNYKFVL